MWSVKRQRIVLRRRRRHITHDADEREFANVENEFEDRQKFGSGRRSASQLSVHPGQSLSLPLLRRQQGNDDFRVERRFAGRFAHSGMFARLLQC